MGSVLGPGHRAELARPLQTIREVQPDVVVVELCQYRVSMLKMDEGALLREAKEISLEKLQQAVRQVRCRGARAGRPPQVAGLPALPAREHTAFQSVQRRPGDLAWGGRGARLYWVSD